MTSWLKDMLWEDFKKEIKFFIKNFKKIIKRAWSESVDEIKRYFRSF